MQNIFANFKKKRNLEDKLKAKELSDVERFNNILKFANEILMEKTYEGKEHPIFDFIRILGRGLQSDYLKYVIYYDCKGGEYEVPDLCWDTIGFEDNMKIVGVNGESIDFYKLIKEIQCNKKLELSKDLILPWPWHRERLLSTIKNIGNGRLWGEWKQDYTNHIVDVWLPMGIAWVHGGNHSITMGIVQGGELKPEIYSDISEVYKHVYCDGKNYMRFRTNDVIKNKIICPVKNVDFAAIFEIGRLLGERGISFKDCIVKDV